MERQNSRRTESQETAEFCNTTYPKADIGVMVRHFSFGAKSSRTTAFASRPDDQPCGRSGYCAGQRV